MEINITSLRIMGLCWCIQILCPKFFFVFPKLQAALLVVRPTCWAKEVMINTRRVVEVKQSQIIYHFLQLSTSLGCFRPRTFFLKNGIVSMALLYITFTYYTQNIFYLSFGPSLCYIITSSITGKSVNHLEWVCSSCYCIEVSAPWS